MFDGIHLPGGKGSLKEELLPNLGRWITKTRGTTRNTSLPKYHCHVMFDGIHLPGGKGSLKEELLPSLGRWITKTRGTTRNIRRDPFPRGQGEPQGGASAQLREMDLDYDFKNTISPVMFTT